MSSMCLLGTIVIRWKHGVPIPIFLSWLISLAFLQVLGVEILNVVHRLLLTRDSHRSQLLVLSIVKKVVQSAKEVLDPNSGTCDIIILKIRKKLVDDSLRKFLFYYDLQSEEF